MAASRQNSITPLVYVLLLLSNQLITSFSASLPLQLDVANEVQTKESPAGERRKCNYDQDGSMDLYMTTPEFIQKQGYPAEVHNVTTKDGFVLGLHRIPNPGKPPIILFHGMLMTTREWFLNCDGRSLPLKLFNGDYDVWLPNARGNKYSMGHTKYNENDAEFWSYSVDEIIAYDAPATIDYVLNATGESKVNWLGWSMGSAVIFGLLSSQPEYNDKVGIVFTFGTVAYVGHTRAILLKLTGYGNRLLDALFTWTNKGKFLPDFVLSIYHRVAPLFCYPEAKLGIPGICSLAFRLIDGNNPGQLNPAFFPLVVANFPSTGSVKMFNQWFQWIRSDRFSHYNYGMWENLRRYRNIRPPEYDITKVKAPCVNFWSDNDYISTPQDVEKTISKLPNVIHNIHINITEWNHMDFGLAKDADLYVYDRVLDILDVEMPRLRNSTKSSEFRRFH